MVSTIGWNSGVQFGFVVAFVLLSAMLADHVWKIQQLPAELRRAEYLHSAGWAIFTLFAALAWCERPLSKQGDPSLLLTVGAGFQLFAFCLIYAIPARGSAARVPAHLTSQRSSGAFALLMVGSFALRLTSTLRYQGYLPTDQTGDGCYQILEGLTLLMAASSLVSDGVTKHEVLSCVAILVGCAFAAQLVYGDLDNDVLADRTYAVSIYTEVCAWGFMLAIALSTERRRRFNGAFILPAGLCALCRANFWHFAYNETKPWKHDRFMDLFPAVILGLSMLTAGMQAVMGVLVLLASPLPEINLATAGEIKELIQASPPTKSGSGVSFPFLGGPKGGFKPGKASLEGDVLKVEYVSI